MKIVLLYGGGIDSTTLLRYLTLRGDKVTSVFARYGQKASSLEEASCSYFCKKYGSELSVVDLDLKFCSSGILSGDTRELNQSSNIILEGRNLLLASVGAMKAAAIGAEALALGFHLEPVLRPFPDASPEFSESLSSVLKTAFTHPLHLELPFLDKSRQEIFDMAKELDAEILDRAHTCYQDVPGGCGVCSHCLIKAELGG